MVKRIGLIVIIISIFTLTYVLDSKLHLVLR